MKKTSVLLMLCAILALSLNQGCKNSETSNDNKQDSLTHGEITKSVYQPVSRSTVITVYLLALKQVSENGDTTFHLAMLDVNGACNVDNLITDIDVEKTRNIKVMPLPEQSGIQEIVNVTSGPGDDLINDITGGKVFWMIHLKPNLPSGSAEQKYNIEFIPENSNDTIISIDPYIRIPD